MPADWRNCPTTTGHQTSCWRHLPLAAPAPSSWQHLQLAGEAVSFSLSQVLGSELQWLHHDDQTACIRHQNSVVRQVHACIMRCMLLCRTDMAALLAAANASGNIQHQHYSQAEAFQVNKCMSTAPKFTCHHLLSRVQRQSEHLQATRLALVGVEGMTSCPSRYGRVLLPLLPAVCGAQDTANDVRLCTTAGSAAASAAGGQPAPRRRRCIREPGRPPQPGAGRGGCSGAAATAAAGCAGSHAAGVGLLEPDHVHDMYT